MSRQHTLLVCCVLVSGAGEAFADPPRRIEAGAFIGFDRFGDDIELGNAWAPEQIPGSALLLGLRGGLVFAPDLAPGSEIDPSLGIELESKFAFSSTGELPANGRDTYFAPVIGWRAQLIARINFGKVVVPHLVLGFGGETVTTSSPFMVDDTDAAFHWGPGASFRITDRWSARLDLRHGLTAGRSSIMVSTLELQLGAGYSWDWGGKKARPRPRPRPEPEPVKPDPEPEPEPVKPPPDADGDGIVDDKDRCPDMPEDKDDFADEDGCPDTDNDDDSILDSVDACPLQPETFNGFAEEDGCPDELPVALKEFTGAIEGITFDTAKARIRPTSKPTLDKAAATLREFSTIRIRIEGHTDDRGKRAKNLALSQKRADAVKWYLVDKGIPADRIETVGHGPDVPVDPAKNAKARAKNRRIEFHIIFQTPVPQASPPPEPAPAPLQ